MAKAKRFLYLALGFACVALGLIGIVLPGLPTTEFLLAGSFFFARSSPTFDTWLRNHKWLGPKLRQFNGGMPRQAKIAALISMWTGITLSSFVLARYSPAGPLVTIALGIAGTLTILYWVRTVPAATTPAQVTPRHAVSLRTREIAAATPLR